MFTDRYFETSIWSSCKNNVKFFNFTKCMLGHKEDVMNNDIYSIIIELKTNSYVIDEAKIKTMDIINNLDRGYSFYELLSFYEKTITETFNKKYYRQILKYYLYKIYDIYKKYVY